MARQEERLVSVTDLAIEHRISYRSCFERVVRGDFGPVERVGNRLYVRRAPTVK